MAASEYLLALDYGERRVGVAVAHMIARIPHPLTTLDNNETLFTAISELVVREGVRLVIVGLPRGMDGGYTEQTRSAEAFANKLRDLLTVPVALADETLTSVDAEASLPHGQKHAKGDIDAMAASLILERYLAEHPAGEVHA
jgi:putative Holliday junction resolvase